MTMKLPFAVERVDGANCVLTVRNLMRIGKGWEQWFLLVTDRHLDNPHADRALMRKHLDQAKERRAGVMEAGDLFCAMQGRDDKRGSKSGVRPEDANSSYFDSIVKSADEFFSPWAENFVMISPGNHETAVKKRHETDLTQRLVERMRTRGSKVMLGTYSGWIRFMFTARTSHRQSVAMAYHHGYGGGGPVTRGVIDTNRMAVYLPDADLIWTGHSHDEWKVPISRERLSQAGIPYLDKAIHFRTPGYKDEYSPHEGFHIEKGRGPKPVGAAWLRFYYESDKIRYSITEAD
jgi:hypothetical protein